jgi:hypothetical protein
MYRETFGVSEPSVSRHQEAFADAFESRVGEVFVRDGNDRVRGGRLVLSGEASLPETPVFPRMPDLEQWLKDNLGGSGYVELEIRRQMSEPWIMRTVIQAIRSRNPLNITYYSRTSDDQEPCLRTQ